MNARIGVSVPVSRQKEILKKLGFVAKGSRMEVPFWRDHDVEDAVDFSEEVARMQGYAQFPSVMPVGAIPFVMQDAWLALERRGKEILSAAGATELFSLTFTSESTLAKLDLSAKDAVHVLNPLTEDQAFMRPTLLGSLLEAVELNEQRFPEAELFELSTVHTPRPGSLPDEHRRLMLGVYGRDGEAAFARAKGLVERFCRELDAPALSCEPGDPHRYAHASRSGQLFIATPEEPLLVGSIFEVAPQLAEKFGLAVRVAVVDLHLDLLLPYLYAQKAYVAAPAFPPVTRDLSFLVDARTTYAELHRTIASSHELLRSANFTDVYQGKGIEPGKKSMTFSLELRSNDHTFTSEEAETVVKIITDKLKQNFGATIR